MDGRSSPLGCRNSEAPRALTIWTPTDPVVRRKYGFPADRTAIALSLFRTNPCLKRRPLRPLQDIGSRSDHENDLRTIAGLEARGGRAVTAVHGATVDAHHWHRSDPSDSRWCRRPAIYSIHRFHSALLSRTLALERGLVEKQPSRNACSRCRAFRTLPAMPAAGGHKEETGKNIGRFGSPGNMIVCFSCAPASPCA